MTATVYVDAAHAAMVWLDAQAPVHSLLGAGRQVFLGLPEGADNRPYIRVEEIADGPDTDTEAPIQSVLLQFTCWGTKRNRALAKQSALTVMGLLDGLNRGGPTTLDTGVVCLGSYGLLSRPRPDPATDQPRHLVDCTLTVRPA